MWFLFLLSLQHWHIFVLFLLGLVTNIVTRMKDVIINWRYLIYVCSLGANYFQGLTWLLPDEFGYSEIGPEAGFVKFW